MDFPEPNEEQGCKSPRKQSSIERMTTYPYIEYTSLCESPGLLAKEANVGVRVLEELLKGGFDLGLNDRRVQNGDECLEGASNVEADIGDGV